MLILLFFPNDHLVWVARMPTVPVAGLLARIRAGDWVFPPAWKARLEQNFDLPDPLPLLARAQGRLLIVTPLAPLNEKTAVPISAMNPRLRERLARMAKGKDLPMQSGKKKP